MLSVYKKIISLFSKKLVEISDELDELTDDGYVIINGSSTQRVIKQVQKEHKQIRIIKEESMEDLKDYNEKFENKKVYQLKLKKKQERYKKLKRNWK